MPSRAKYFTIICIGIATCGVLAMHTYFTSTKEESINIFASALSQKEDFPMEIIAFRTLMDAIGPESAQDEAVKILPSNSRTHMLIHESGKYLYAKHGMHGIALCRPYAAGACYHGFILAVITEQGVNGVQSIVQSCRSGLTQEQEMQCPHGVGHAVLTTEGYEHLPKALDLCETLFTGDLSSQGNCYDGVFMENSFGVFNEPPPGRYFKRSDPMYPCNEPWVLAKPTAHEYCWGMLSQLTILNSNTFPQFGGSVKKAGDYCESLPQDSTDQNLCFDGLGRQIQLLHSDSDDEILKKCSELSSLRAAECIGYALGASYIYGNRGFTTIPLCEKMRDGEAKCLSRFFLAIPISYSRNEDRINACRHFDQRIADICLSWLHSPENSTL